MKKVVISGVNGFIGSALCNMCLSMGYRVIGIFRSEDKHNLINKSENFIPMQIDKIDIEVLKEADIFYHLAWNMKLYNTKDSLLATQVELDNIKMSCEMMDYAIKAQVKKFVFIGSISQEMYYFDDSRKLTDIKGRIYGLGKQMANEVCKKMAYDANIEYNLAILANTFGPNDYNKKAVSQFIMKMSTDEDLDLIEENDLADWVYIDDTVAGLIAIGNKGHNMKSYYIGHDKIITFKEYIEKLKEALGSKSKLNFGVFTELMGYDYSKVDLEALYNDTGFKCNSNFEESVIKTRNWLNKNR